MIVLRRQFTSCVTNFEGKNVWKNSQKIFVRLWHNETWSWKLSEMKLIIWGNREKLSSKLLTEGKFIFKIQFLKRRGLMEATSYKLGRIIWWRKIIRLRKIIQKYSMFVLLFATQIGSKQASLFILHTKQILFKSQKMSNTTEYWQWWAF